MDDATNQAIERAVRQAIAESLPAAIEKTVNGKIDGMRRELKPVTDAFNGWQHIRAQTTFWIGGILAFGGAIQAVQSIWTLLVTHLNFKP